MTNGLERRIENLEQASPEEGWTLYPHDTPEGEATHN